MLQISAHYRDGFETSMNENGNDSARYGGDNRGEGNSESRGEEVGGAPVDVSGHVVGFGSVKRRRVNGGGWLRMAFGVCFIRVLLPRGNIIVLPE